MSTQKDARKIRHDDPAARKVVTLMLLTFRNYCLYPESHTICINCIRNLKGALDGFFEGGESFPCGVARDQLLFQGSPMYHHTGEAPGENLPGILYRDGIRRVEFKPGIEASELSLFFNILIKYRYLDDEPEGDLVTALWEIDSPHILYDAVLYWEVEPLNRFPALNPAGRPLEDVRQLMEVAETENSRSPAEQPLSITLWQLKEEEIERLKEMIAREEAWNETRDVLGVLLDILEEQDRPDEFDIVLEFLREEYLNGLETREFGYAAKLVRQLVGVRRQSAIEKPWALPCCEHFMDTISGSEAANAIRRSLVTDTKVISDPVLRDLKELLHLFRPAMVPMLAPILMETRSPKLQRVLMHGIAHLLKKDLQPVEPVLEGGTESLIRMMVHILGFLEGEKVDRLLLRMFRHDSAGVRKQALKSLMKQRPAGIEAFFSAIDDPDRSIRFLLLNHLRTHRSARAEPLLLAYLKEGESLRYGKEHILACYSALGHCASSNAIPFLRGVLMNRFWSGLFGGAPAYEKEGAARALAILNVEEAREVLQQASHSLFPHIRKICKKVMGEMHGR